MKGETKSISRNLWVLVLFLLIVGCTIAAIIIGQNQDEKYKTDFDLNNQAMQNIQASKLGDAEKELQKLIQSYPDSYQLQWRYAAVLSMEGRYKDSEAPFTRARELFPYLVQNQSYDAQVGEVFYRTGNYDRAKKYLLEVKKINTNPDLSKQVDPILQDIDRRLQKK